MKTLTVILLLVLGGTASSTLAQGTVSFANSAGTPIINWFTGTHAEPEDIVVGLYWRPDMETDWALVGAPAELVAPGIFVAGPRTIPGAPPTTIVDLQVRAWPPGFPDYESAVSSGSPIYLEGVSKIMTLALGGGTLPTPSLVIQGGFESFVVQPVPEPSTFALAALGIAGLLFFRRRT